MARGFGWQTAACAVALCAAATPASAQIDPLLFLKTAPPNVLFVVDAGHRMQRGAPADNTTQVTSTATSDYYDSVLYPKDTSYPSWQASLGVSDANTSSFYRRVYRNMNHANKTSSDRFLASRIDTAGDRTGAAYARFEAPTRLSIARAGLYQALNENKTVARFGLLKMRQTSPTVATKGNSGPVAVSDLGQLITETGSLTGQWRVSRPTVSSSGAGTNGSSSSTGVVMVKADTGTATDVLNVLNKDTRTAGGLLPTGNDDLNTVDTPVKLMLDDARAEAARLIALSNDPTCRNTVVVLVVGGGEGNTSGFTNASLEAAAANFLSISGRRVPIYVIAIAPPQTDVDGLRKVATKSGGLYLEITKAQIDAALASPMQTASAGVTAPSGTVVVPEVVKSVNLAIQHAFATSTDVNTAPSVQFPIGPISEFQVTSPIVGTVNLDDAKDINGSSLVPNSSYVLDKQGSKIPLRSNLLVTAGFTMPGFDGLLRGYRIYKPVVDNNQTSGYRFVSDGTQLWQACVPGPGCAAAPDPSKRNLYTVTTAGTMIAFTAANAATLAPMMNVSVADATTVINAVRALPMGAIVSSTPAVMNAPSLDPPPDSDYPKFVTDNEKRRSIIWVGTNHGILEGIDARFGVEVWGFIPVNLLPKLKTLVDGQPVGSFGYFVDSSAKVADVKYGGNWRTHLIIGEGPGGTFYQSFDVTMPDMTSVLGADADSDPTVDQVLSYFSAPNRIGFNWAFPSYSMFSPALSTYGDVSSLATPIEKSVGQTWSDPAVGQIFGTNGPYTVLVGSGFLPFSTQQQGNRAGKVAGTTFYVLDAETGAVLASKDVGSDGVNETNNNCAVDNTDGCAKSKNALQSDLVATGPTDSRFITKAYIGDLDGNLWRFDIGLDSSSKPVINATVKLYAAGATQPIFSSMATVTVSTQQYVFFGTGSDLLPATDKNTLYHLLGILESGSTGTKTFDRTLTKTASGNTLTSDERVTAFPAVAGDIVFFTTTMVKATCSLPDANLYAFTFIGGAAYDNTGDNTVSKADTPLVKTVAGQRATAPFIVDQHLVFGSGSNVSLFGDPQDYNNGIGQAGVRVLSWREVR